MRLRFLLAGITATLFALAPVGSCRGGFGGGGFHGAGEAKTAAEPERIGDFDSTANSSVAAPLG